MKERIKVVKLANGFVSYRIPGKNASRRWRNRPGGPPAIQMVPKLELEDCIYDDAIKTLFDGGYLSIEDDEFKKEFGLIEKEQSVADATKKKVLNKIEINKILFNEDISREDFEETLKSLAPATVDVLIGIAKSTSKHLSYDKYDAIKNVFNIDIEKVKSELREEEQE